MAAWWSARAAAQLRRESHALLLAEGWLHCGREGFGTGPGAQPAPAPACMLWSIRCMLSVPAVLSSALRMTAARFILVTTTTTTYYDAFYDHSMHIMMLITMPMTMMHIVMLLR